VGLAAGEEGLGRRPATDYNSCGDESRGESEVLLAGGPGNARLEEADRTEGGAINSQCYDELRLLHFYRTGI
jgi:hypothetical protein